MTIEISKKMSLSSFRKDFPMLFSSMHGKPLVYLDSAATAQKPQLVIDAISDFYRNHYGTVNRAVYALAQDATERYQGVREKVRAFIGAGKCSEIIFTRGTTESINLVANTFGRAFIRKDDEIIITEIEHHSNLVPWQLLCQQSGAKLNVVPVDEQGQVIVEAYEELLSPRTKLVAITHVSNAIGTIVPVKEMTEMAHAYGAKVLIDGAQAIPHMAINVQDIDADFYAFSGHKLYGPTGIGILYGKEEILEIMPPFHGGGDMVDKVTVAHTSYQKSPLKFEAGTPMIAEVIGLGAALDYLNLIGMDEIQSWEHELYTYAAEKLNQIKGVTLLGDVPQKGAIISFIVEGVHPLDLGTMLDLEGIAIRTGHQCTQTTMARFDITAAARISFGLYNTKDEVDRFISSLIKVIALLK